MQQEQSISSQNLSDSRLSRFGFHSKKPSDSAFYKAFFSMYPLLVLQNVVTLSVNLADNMMLGAYGESALSGAAAVNQIQFVYQCLLTALGDGLVMFGSQYWGKKQLSPLRKIAASAMHFGLLLSAVLFLLVSIFPIQALRIFTTDSAILEQGAQYLSIIRFTYLFFAITQILLATLRSVEIVGIAFRLSCMALLVNCSINYLLIFGHFGFPQLGISRCGDRHADRPHIGGYRSACLPFPQRRQKARAAFFQLLPCRSGSDEGLPQNNSPYARHEWTLGRQYRPADRYFRAYDSCCHRGKQRCLDPLHAHQIHRRRCFLHSLRHDRKSSRLR